MGNARSRAVHHVGRYPKLYAAAAIWAVAMVALPVITSRAGTIFRPDVQPSGQSDLPLAAPTLPSGFNAVAPLIPLVLGVPPTTAPPLEPPESKPPELVEPTFFDNLFNLIPPPPALPNLPPSVLAVIRTATPIASKGCTGLGLASLVVAVVAPSLEGVPIERILPYLAPVTSACAYFPIPPTHTVCAADEPFVVDVGGLTTTPPVLGLGIDQLTAIEDLVIEQFGLAFPRISETPRQQLDCKLVTE